MTMKQRKTWTQQQDSILILLRDQRKIKKWPDIAKIMAQQYNIQGKNGKKCRQRYINHLKAGINNQDWTEEQQNILLLNHLQYGNKWSFISQNLPGRVDNCVKNHFYSRLRKGLRKINKFSFLLFQTENLQFKKSILTKLLKVADSKFKSAKLNQDQIQFCSDLITRLFKLGQDNNQIYLSENEEFLKQFILDLQSFDKNNKKFCRIKKKIQTQYQCYLKIPEKNKSLSSRSSRSDDSSSIASSCSSYFQDQSSQNQNQQFQDTTYPVKTRSRSATNSNKSSTNYSQKSRKRNNQQIQFNFQNFKQDNLNVKPNKSVSSQNYKQMIDMFEINCSFRHSDQNIMSFQNEGFNIFFNNISQTNQINQIRQMEQQNQSQNIFYQNYSYAARILGPTQPVSSMWDDQLSIQNEDDNVQ